MNSPGIVGILLLLLISAYALTATRAQSVVIPHDPLSHCETLNTSICDSNGVMEGSVIYINSTHPQALLINALTLQLRAVGQSKRHSRFPEQIGLLDVLGFTSCATSLKEYACLGAFSPCVTFDTQSAAGIVATPALPCYNSCKAAEALCTPAFRQIGLSFPPCPPEQIVYDLSAEGGGSVTATCTAFAEAPAQVSCPLSVVFWGKHYTETIRTLLIVFGYIGLIECILVMALTVANKKTMKWPGPLILLLGFGQLMIAFANTISSWTSLYNMHCNSEALYKNICRTQGFFIVAGTHFIITSWLIMTAITAWCIWSPNPATALRLSRKYWWVVAACYVVPVAFIIYCSVSLGSISVPILCITNRSDIEEHGVVLPLLAQVCIGTLLWLVSIAGAIRTFGVTGSTVGTSGKRPYKIYARLLLYEMVAIVPSALFTFPVEVYRKELLAFDHGVITQSFIHGGMVRVVTFASIASLVAPVLFGTIFLIRPEHYYFLRARYQSYSGSSTGSGPSSRVSSASRDQRANL